MDKFSSVGIGGHQSAKMLTDEWLTPPEIIKALGSFDLDPCSPINRPWQTATKHYTVNDNGLLLPWEGRVWMNPPYGNKLSAWLNKLALHGDGIALTFARTDTKAFHDYVFDFASSIFFFKKRLTFYDVNGNKGKYTGGAPSCLISYGKENLEAIGDANLSGRHLLINYTPVIVVGIDRTWKTVISISLDKLNGEASLKAIYEVVDRVAPEKVRKNENYKAKVRQVLQTYFIRVSKGQYSKVNE